MVYITRKLADLDAAPSTVHARLVRPACALLLTSHFGVAVTAVTTSAISCSASASRHASIRAGLFELPP